MRLAQHATRSGRVSAWGRCGDAPKSIEFLLPRRHEEEELGEQTGPLKGKTLEMEIGGHSYVQVGIICTVTSRGE